MRPQPMPFTAGGRRTALPVWHLGRTPLFDRLGVAMEAGEVRVARGGDATALAEELEGLEREVTAAGNIRYVTTGGRHDDLAISLALLVWACARIPQVQVAAMPRALVPPVGAWV